MQKAEGFRPQMPALYNEMRERERPIPRAELSTNAINVGDENNEHEEQEELETTFFDSRELNSSTIDVKPVIDDENLAAFDILFEETVANQLDPLANNSGGPEEADSNNPSAILSTASETLSNEIDDEQEIAKTQSAVFSEPIVSFDNVIEHESTRIDAIETVENAAHNEMIHDDLSGISLEAEAQEREGERERQIAINTQKVILFGEKVVVDDDCEFISLPNQKLEPIKDAPKYQVKCNDVVSGKKAFKEYVICIFIISISRCCHRQCSDAFSFCCIGKRGPILHGQESRRRIR